MKTIRLPGGLSVGFSGLEGVEAYHRAMDQVGAVTAPLKAVLDILTFALGIKRVLESAPAIPVDPAEFVSRLREITVNATRLLSLLPQVSVPVLVRDMCSVLVDLIQLVRDEIANAQELGRKKAEVEAAVAIDPALESVVLMIEGQEDAAKEGLAEMLEPLILVGAIIDTFLELVGAKPLGLSAELVEDLGALDSLLVFLQEELMRMATA